MILKSDSKEHILKIGSKGEIFPSKEIRDLLGLQKDQTFILTVYKNLLIIRKLHSIEELSSSPPIVTVSIHAWEQFQKQLSKDAES